jgi:hypothetical protein
VVRIVKESHSCGISGCVASCVLAISEAAHRALLTSPRGTISVKSKSSHFDMFEVLAAP